ncbi:MAG: ATP-binding cassette domain-containing protein, partial [Planctomycetes bacterium]|nr:ATP-binding cassette domain-containing protein [Planctomycetota bacterium]
LGPSGVGKTVLMEIIAGLIGPDEGRILWDDADITSRAPEARGFSVVYQDYALFPHLTVRRNIAYGLEAASARAEKICRQVAGLAEILRIEEILDRYPKSLSGGEQQRVALARALAVGPQLLLLDEPLSAVDVNTRLRLRKELKRINTELNVPVLHITHDPQEAITLGDRICVMLDSRIRQVGSAAELFHEPCEPDVARFLGMRNILAVSEVKSGACFVDGRQIQASDADETTTHIWIRPEEIVISTEAFESSARNQFTCLVAEIEHHGSLLAVQVVSGAMSLTALITYRSFKELGIAVGAEAYITFKSSAVHCL